MAWGVGSDIDGAYSYALVDVRRSDFIAGGVGNPPPADRGATSHHESASVHAGKSSAIDPLKWLARIRWGADGHSDPMGVSGLTD